MENKIIARVTSISYRKLHDDKWDAYHEWNITVGSIENEYKEKK